MAKFEHIEEQVKKQVDEIIENVELTIGMTLKEAVEKQIPKRLKETEAYPHRLYCPQCYFTLAFNKDNADFIKSNQMYNYCPSCGQALDWTRDLNLEGKE